MRKPPSALVAIGGFGVAVATLSVAVTAAIVLLAPQPPQKRMSAADAVIALREGNPEFERNVAGPPEGVRSQLLESLVAAELERPTETVRVVFPEGTADTSFNLNVDLPTDFQSLEVQQRSSPMVFVDRGEGGLEMVESREALGTVQNALVNVPMPAFAASVLQDDGRWLTVQPSQPFWSGWRRNVLVALAVSLLLLAPLAWFFARRLTRPFRALAKALGNTANPVPQEGPRELREAALAIADMRSSLTAEATERARILTAIAHDLRTPLTGLRLRVESVPEPQRGRMVGDIERMQSMIGEVLGFARDAASPSERIALRPFVSAALADMSVPEGKIAILPGDEAEIDVPPLAFRRVFENLVRNALDYAGSGEIKITCEGSIASLTVADHGPGIAREERQRLMQPFERGEASRSRETGGTGLGLSIVRDFALRYSGEFVLADAQGGGTSATLRLPTFGT